MRTEMIEDCISFDVSGSRIPETEEAVLEQIYTRNAKCWYGVTVRAHHYVSFSRFLP